MYSRPHVLPGNSPYPALHCRQVPAMLHPTDELQCRAHATTRVNQLVVVDIVGDFRVKREKDFAKKNNS